MNPLPPKWPGIMMIMAGVLGLTFMVEPKAAGIALIVVVLAACLLCALGALSALIAAERADRAMGVTSEEVERSAREYADVLRERLRMEEAEVSAASVIQGFPARGSATEPQNKGGDQGSASDTATPGAITPPSMSGSLPVRVGRNTWEGTAPKRVSGDCANRDAIARQAVTSGKDRNIS